MGVPGSHAHCHEAHLGLDTLFQPEQPHVVRSTPWGMGGIKMLQINKLLNGIPKIQELN